MSDPKIKRVCVFCGGTPLTNEHLFPQWVANTVLKDPRGYPLDSRKRVRMVDGTERRWESTTPLAFTARTVCKTCNNTWMSEIENQAKPYLEPMITASSPVVLDEPAQGAVATWMVLRFLIARSSGSQPWPDETHQLFRWFGDNRVVSPSCFVWVGMYKGGLPAYFEVGPYHPPGATGVPHGALFSCVIGYLIFKICIVRDWGTVLSYPGRGLAKIAPPVASQVEWPPGGDQFTDETILKFFGMGLASPPVLAEYWDEIQNA